MYVRFRSVTDFYADFRVGRVPTAKLQLIGDHRQLQPSIGNRFEFERYAQRGPFRFRDEYRTAANIVDITLHQIYALISQLESVYIFWVGLHRLEQFLDSSASVSKLFQPCDVFCQKNYSVYALCHNEHISRGLALEIYCFAIQSLDSCTARIN